eukprot:ctg_672.g369
MSKLTVSETRQDSIAGPAAGGSSGPPAFSTVLADGRVESSGKHQNVLASSAVQSMPEFPVTRRRTRLPGAAQGHHQGVRDESAHQGGDDRAQQSEARADRAGNFGHRASSVHCHHVRLVPDQGPPLLYHGVLCGRRVLSSAAAPAPQTPAGRRGTLLRGRGAVGAGVPASHGVHLPRSETGKHPHARRRPRRPHRFRPQQAGAPGVAARHQAPAVAAGPNARRVIAATRLARQPAGSGDCRLGAGLALRHQLVRGHRGVHRPGGDSRCRTHQRRGLVDVWHPAVRDAHRHHALQGQLPGRDFQQHRHQRAAQARSDQAPRARKRRQRYQAPSVVQEDRLYAHPERQAGRHAQGARPVGFLAVPAAQGRGPR